MNYYLFLLNTNAPPKQKEASQTHFSVYTAVNKEDDRLFMQQNFKSFEQNSGIQPQKLALKVGAKKLEAPKLCNGKIRKVVY